MNVSFGKLTTQLDNMANAIEVISIEKLVQESELIESVGSIRQFEFKLDEKAAKGKLMKGAKRIPFEVIKNSSSSNLDFSLGAWNNIVQPSISYWREAKGNKTCKIDDMLVRIVDVKSGKDVSGNHIDTQIVFFANRDKVVLHCYNTTQRILVNGHGYSRFIDMFLTPYFESKINLNQDGIAQFNKNALAALGSKSVKRSDVKYTGGPTHLWCTRCDFAAKSRAALMKHKKTKHALNFSSKTSPSTSLVFPQHHSTRNNSIVEALQQDNMTLKNISIRRSGKSSRR